MHRLYRLYGTDCTAVAKKNSRKKLYLELCVLRYKFTQSHSNLCKVRNDQLL